jgi:hypothetical protein
MMVIRSSIFLDITPCSLLKVHHLLHAISCFAYSPTLKVETCSSETSISFQWTRRWYIPEDRPLVCIRPLNMETQNWDFTVHAHETTWKTCNIPLDLDSPGIDLWLLDLRYHTNHIWTLRLLTKIILYNIIILIPVFLLSKYSNIIILLYGVVFLNAMSQLWVVGATIS